MIGYGPEASHFVIELTYNYGVREYALGNDSLFSPGCLLAFLPRCAGTVPVRFHPAIKIECDKR